MFPTMIAFVCTPQPWRLFGHTSSSPIYRLQHCRPLLVRYITPCAVMQKADAQDLGDRQSYSYRDDAEPPPSRRVSDQLAAKRREKPPMRYTEDFETPEIVTMRTIGVVRSPYKERFGTPRQPVVSQNTLGNKMQPATIELYKNCRKKQGVFATRSPHRPNSIGLSCIRITGVDERRGLVHLLGVDLLDGTPVLDIKPYVPYCDSFPNAKSGWLDKLNEDMKAPDALGYYPPPAHLMQSSSTKESETREENEKTVDNSKANTSGLDANKNE